MNGYFVSDLAHQYKATIPPEVCHAILKQLGGPEGIRKMFRYNQDPLIGRRVHESVESIILGANIHVNRNREQDTPPATASAPPATAYELDQWLSVSEVAALLGVTPRTVGNYRDRGWLTGRKKDGKSWEIEQSSAIALDVELKSKAA